MPGSEVANSITTSPLVAGARAACVEVRAVVSSPSLATLASLLLRFLSTLVAALYALINAV